MTGRAVDQTAPTKLNLGVALVLTLVAGLFGLPTLLFEFPSLGSSLAAIAWKLATLAVMFIAIRLLERRAPSAQGVGLKPWTPKVRHERTKFALPVVVALTLIAMFWTQIPGLNELSAAAEGSSYDAGSVSSSLLIFELVARYPLQVVAEEVFFRGYMQPRLAKAAPVVGGVLFALYHLQQFETIPSLIPFGVALALLRWWLGSIWPGVAFHYVGNAMFILSLR